MKEFKKRRLERRDLAYRIGLHYLARNGFIRDRHF